MSFQTTAILFYGIKLDSLSANARQDEASDVRVDYFGSDDCLTHFVAPLSGTYRADLDTSLVLQDIAVANPKWDAMLRAFCDKHEIAWGDGPAWHLAPVRV